MSNSFENTALKKASFSHSTDNGVCRAKLNDSAQSFVFHESYKYILEGLSSVTTLRDLALWLYKRKIVFNYQGLIRVIQTLVERGFVLNSGTFLESIYELREKFRWRRPLLRTSILSFEIGKTIGTGNLPSVFSISLASLFFALGSASAFTFFDQMDWNLQQANWLHAMIGWWAIASISFVIIGIFDALFSILIRGVFPAFNVEISLLGADVVFDRYYFFGSRKENQAAFIQASLLLLYFFIAKWSLPLFNFEPATLTAVKFLLMLTFIIETSPVSKTRLSDIIKLIYHGRADKTQSNRVFEKVTFGAMLIWFSFAIASLTMLWLHNENKISIAAIGLAYLASCARDMATVFRWVFSVQPVESYFSTKKVGAQNTSTHLALSQSIEEIFNQFALLRNLPEGLKQQMYKNLEVVRASKGQKICREGSLDRRMFGIVSGRVGVYKQQITGNQFIVDLHPGSLFGEVSFFSGAKRTATVVALEDTELIQFTNENQIELNREQFSALQDRIWLSQTLVASPLFQGLPLETVDQVLSLGRVSMVPPGYNLTIQGEPGDGFFIIIQGEAKVLVGGREVKRLARGQVVGELALTQHQPRSSTVTAISDMELLAISKQDFWNLVSSNWGLGLTLDQLSQDYVF